MDSIFILSYKKVVKFLLIGLLLQFLCSCNIAEDRDDCPPDKRLIYIRIIDILTGTDITESTDEIESLSLYLFDRNREFLNSYEITPEQIYEHIPVDVTDMDIVGGYATVWANISELDKISEPVDGDILDTLQVLLIKNSKESGYYMCPGDLFFGYAQLNFTENSTCCENAKQSTVDVKRKNGQLYITVRGLRNITNASDYYFRINTWASGYDFAGNPIMNLSRNIMETGIMNTSNDFISPEPYFMIHSPLTDLRASGNAISVSLYEAAAGTELISASADVNGNAIRFESGITTNILMEILETGDLQVQIELTDWDEIFQWESW